MTIAILKGKALTSAIAGHGKQVATFTEKQHQLALSCLHHADANSCAIPLNALYKATPTNFRAGLKAYAVAFGKVAWDSGAGQFAFAKKRKSDLDGAAKVSPAEYQRASGGKGKQDKTEAEELAAFAKRVGKLIDAIDESDTDGARLSVAISHLARAEKALDALAALVEREAKAETVADAADRAEIVVPAKGNGKQPRKSQKGKQDAPAIDPATIVPAAEPVNLATMH